MKKITTLILVTLLLLSSVIYAQKTVRVREYRRKDGTVVRTHTRRAPRSRSRSTDPLIISEDPLELEPYETVDLGGGSFYTPGGTGVTRPRQVGKQ